jgi:hypothetical protein
MNVSVSHLRDAVSTYIVSIANITVSGIRGERDFLLVAKAHRKRGGGVFALRGFTAP